MVTTIGKVAWPTQHVLHLGHLVNDLIHRDRDKIHDHDFDNGGEAQPRLRLRQYRLGPIQKLRCLRIRLSPYFGMQTRFGAKGTTNAHVFACNKYFVITAHFLIDGFVDGRGPWFY